jgi:hypothetical protein
MEGLSFSVLFSSELFPDKHFVKHAPSQGLKPNPLSILYGPTKVVPCYKTKT